MCVGSSADAVCQLESQHRALRHQPRLLFCLLSHLEGREDVAESCNSRSKHTAALKIRAKAFLYKHMVLFILLFSLSNAYLPSQSCFQPQGKRVVGREAGLVTGVGHSYRRWVIWTFIPGSALASCLPDICEDLKK